VSYCRRLALYTTVNAAPAASTPPSLLSAPRTYQVLHPLPALQKCDTLQALFHPPRQLAAWRCSSNSTPQRKPQTPLFNPSLSRPPAPAATPPPSLSRCPRTVRRTSSALTWRSCDNARLVAGAHAVTRPPPCASVRYHALALKPCVFIA
jgi:hypothetical protein